MNKSNQRIRKFNPGTFLSDEEVIGQFVVRKRELDIMPLEILTGGNPRLLVIVAQFAQHRSLHQLIEELVTLIDDHTEYFRSHLEVLASVERRVYLALLDLWDPSKEPSSAGEIAARARMDVRIASTMLRRLVDREMVIFKGTAKVWTLCLKRSRKKEQDPLDYPSRIT